MSIQLLPHTADLRVVLRAPDLPALYRVAVELVRDMLVGESDVRDAMARTVEVASATEGERLFRFTRELLYLYDTDQFVPSTLRDLRIMSVGGETFDGSRHAVRYQVKALTRHAYAFRKTAGGYEAEMVFDL